MKYLVTGADGKLAGRVANNMLEAVAGTDLILHVQTLQECLWKRKLLGRKKE